MCSNFSDSPLICDKVFVKLKVPQLILIMNDAKDNIYLMQVTNLSDFSLRKFIFFATFK